MTNLREFRKWNDYTAIGLSILFNSFIMFLACTERNSILRSYSRMIILSCIMDYIFCIGSFVSITDVVIKDGTFIAISDGLFRFLPIQYHYIFTGIHIFVVGCATCTVPVDYIYRYQLICKKRELSTCQLIFVVLNCCLICLITTFLFIWAFGGETPIEAYRYAKLLRDEAIWEETDGNLLKFIGTDYTNPHLLLAIFVSAIVSTLTYVICIFLGYKIYMELNSMRSIISQRTLKLQRNMTWVLIIKVLVPFSLATAPVLCLVITVSWSINIPNFGLWLVMVNSWIPVISPLSTLFLLSGYRRRITNGLRSSSVVNYATNFKAYANSMTYYS